MSTNTQLFSMLKKPTSILSDVAFGYASANVTNGLLDIIPSFVLVQGVLKFFHGASRWTEADLTSPISDDQAIHRVKEKTRAAVEMITGIAITATPSSAIQFFLPTASIMSIAFLKLAINSFIELATAIMDCQKAWNSYSVAKNDNLLKYRFYEGMTNVFAKITACAGWATLFSLGLNPIGLSLLACSGILHLTKISFDFGCTMYSSRAIASQENNQSKKIPTVSY